MMMMMMMMITEQINLVFTDNQKDIKPFSADLGGPTWYWKCPM